MEPLNVSEEAIKDHCSDYESEDEIVSSRRKFNSKKLVNGINLKDLYDGKEVLFEISKGYDESVLEQEDPEILEGIIHNDTKLLREKRGAHPLNCSFESIASKMFDIMENGLVKKQVITHGSGAVVPDFAHVTVHYNLYKEHCEMPFDSTYLRGRPERLRMDQGETIIGLEHAIKSMKKNENSQFFIKWEVAFGALGCPDRIEPKCDLVADITLVNFTEVEDIPGLNGGSNGEVNRTEFNKFINQAKQHHCRGSDEFNKGDPKSAIFCYRKALRILDDLRLANEDQESIMLKLKVKCLVNLAVCYNKLGRNEQACLACQEALSIDHKNAKAYFHYGRANLALSNFNEAQKLLTRANKLKPNDKDINKELKRLDDKKLLYQMKDKLFWKKAFKENQEEEENSEEPCSSLETFEEDLKTSLMNCIDGKKPFILPGPLIEDEKRICKKIADSLNLSFETKSDISMFQIKETKS